MTRIRLRPLIALTLTAATLAHGGTARADAADQAIEQALAAAQQSQRGVTLYVGGQVIAGAVVKIEPGHTVELRNQQHGRIVVRVERIDGLALP